MYFLLLVMHCFVQGFFISLTCIFPHSIILITIIMFTLCSSFIKSFTFYLTLTSSFHHLQNTVCLLFLLHLWPEGLIESHASSVFVNTDLISAYMLSISLWLTFSLTYNSCTRFCNTSILSVSIPSLKLLLKLFLPSGSDLCTPFIITGTNNIKIIISIM